MNNPWQTISSKKVYENDWIDVQHHEVINPSKNKGIYGVVHFKNIAVGIIPIDEHGFTYIVGQYRFPLQEYSWEIPEGGCPKHETPEFAALRELREETGLISGQLELIQTIHTSNSVTDEVAYIYKATQLTHGPSSPEETEDLKIKKIHLDEAVKMVLNGEITDSMSVSGLLKLAIIDKRL